jgi:hypothetical protein
MKQKPKKRNGSFGLRKQMAGTEHDKEATQQVSRVGVSTLKGPLKGPLKRADSNQVLLVFVLRTSAKQICNN